MSALRLEGADATVATPFLHRHGWQPLAPSTAWSRAAEVRFSERADGDMADPCAADPSRAEQSHADPSSADLSCADPELAARRRALVDRPWTWLRQVHGARVVVVDQPGGAAGESADGAVTNVVDAALAILTADCAPIALASPEGVIGAVHAGWRGLLAGVVSETVATMRSLGATAVLAALGPCIHQECYSFGETELDELVARFGQGVRGHDHSGRPALDVPSAVRSALAQSDATLVSDADVCTACSPDHWSWRARGETQRQAMVVWRP